MNRVSEGRIKVMREKHKMTWLELWRDTMCGAMPVPEAGKCITPDGVITRGISCDGCRYNQE